MVKVWIPTPPRNGVTRRYVGTPLRFHNGEVSMHVLVVTTEM